MIAEKNFPRAGLLERSYHPNDIILRLIILEYARVSHSGYGAQRDGSIGSMIPVAGSNGIVAIIGDEDFRAKTSGR